MTTPFSSELAAAATPDAPTTVPEAKLAGSGPSRRADPSWKTQLPAASGQAGVAQKADRPSRQREGLGSPEDDEPDQHNFETSADEPNQGWPSYLLLAQAPAQPAVNSPASAGTPAQDSNPVNPRIEPVDVKPSMESRLLTPLTQTASWASTQWFGSAPVGAAGTGALLALAALAGGGGGGSGSAGTAPTADTTAPTLQTAQITDSNGTQLVLSYDEAISSALPDKSVFQVLVDGSVNAVSSVARGSDLKSVVLTLSTAVSSPRTVKVSLGDGQAIKDLAGNTAASLREQQVTVIDKVAPTLLGTSAISNASQSVIVLRYSEDLLAGALPAATDFAVLVDGLAASISSTQILGDSVRLSMANRITASNPAIRLSDATPSDHAKALQDAAGNRAAAIDAPGGLTVSHSLDSAAPALGTSASAVAAVDRNARQIRLTFNEPLDAGSLPATANLSVDVSSAGSTRNITVSSLKLAGTVLELTLADTVSDPLAGLRVRYAPPAGGTGLRDWAGNPVAAFDRSVATVDAVAPTLISSRFTSDRALELTFDETLGANGPDKSAFVLTANGGTELKPATASVSGKTITLTFDVAIKTGQTATLKYIAPSVDPTVLNQALQDTSGNDSSEFSMGPDTTAPTLSSAVTTGNGLQVLLNYSETLLSPSSSGTPTIPAVATSAFRVFKGNSQQASISSVSISGSQVQINLDAAVLPGETVSVFYLPPAASIGVNNAAVQDSSGNDAAALGSGVNGQTVSNLALTSVTQGLLDTQAGPFDRVLLSLNEAFAGTLPDKSAFSVRVAGNAQSIASLSGAGQGLVLQLSGPITEAGEVRVAYTAPASNPLKGASGKNMASFDQPYGQLILGTAGDDTLNGQAGRVDYFLGSAGNDIFSGLGGADHYVWPEFPAGPSGWRQTLKDFGFKKGSGTLQGTAEADILDLSQLLEGYNDADKSQFLRFSKNTDGKLELQIDHNGGASFSATATLVFDNTSFNSSNQLLAGGQTISDDSGALTLSTVLTHLMSQSQLAVL